MRRLPAAGPIGAILLALSASCGEPDESSQPEASESKGQAELIIGVWESTETFDVAESQPCLEFRKDGTFRMRTQFAEEREGTWKLEKGTSLVMNYPASEFSEARTIRFSLMKLDGESLQLGREGRNRVSAHRRIVDWPSEVEEPAHSAKD